MKPNDFQSTLFFRLSPSVTGTATSAKLQKQILSHSASKHQDLGYHTLLNKHVGTCSTSSLESGSENLSNGGSGGLWVRKNYH